MIHYHGTPVTPLESAIRLFAGRHAFVSFAAAQQVEIVAEVAQSFALDNGAFSAWKARRPTDWPAYYAWSAKWLSHPGCDWAVIPDVIDGDEAANDALLAEWPHGKALGVPVWHLHESIERLCTLVKNWPRVAFGSSGAFARVGADSWWQRMGEALAAICDEAGRPKTKLHGLRMLNPAVFTRMPFASADSTNIARNVGIDKRWTNGTYQPPKEWRALVMAARIEAMNGAAYFDATSWPVPVAPVLE